MLDNIFIILTRCSVGFSLLFSRSLFKLHLTEVHNGSCTLEHAVFLFWCEAQHIEGFLRRNASVSRGEKTTFMTHLSSHPKFGFCLYLNSFSSSWHDSNHLIKQCNKHFVSVLNMKSFYKILKTKALTSLLFLLVIAFADGQQKHCLSSPYFDVVEDSNLRLS